MFPSAVWVANWRPPRFSHDNCTCRTDSKPISLSPIPRGVLRVIAQMSGNETSPALITAIGIGHAKVRWGASMQLSIKSLSIVAGLLWGGAILAVGLANMADPPYGSAFLQGIGSIYPGFHASRTFADVLVGTGYALVDGALGGFFFGWLYNFFART